MSFANIIPDRILDCSIFPEDIFSILKKVFIFETSFLFFICSIALIASSHISLENFPTNFVQIDVMITFTTSLILFFSKENDNSDCKKKLTSINA
mmetsp:Transcript_33159/g.81434  ORF Transcript_33159/g.81434 Transcript_33159/m.81434 type:complete len:95 (+) Transcript_33159:1115-1399(+)